MDHTLGSVTVDHQNDRNALYDIDDVGTSTSANRFELR